MMGRGENSHGLHRPTTLSYFSLVPSGVALPIEKIKRLCIVLVGPAGLTWLRGVDFQKAP